VPFVWEFYV